MNFVAAINWLSISINLLLVVFVIVCLLMTLLILMQRPKQEGLGAAFGGGVTDQVFGARTTNVLQRGTVYLGSLFFVLSLTLAVLIGHQNKEKGLLDRKKPAAEQTGKTGENQPAEADQPKSLTEELPAETETPAPTEAGNPPAETETTPEEESAGDSPEAGTPVQPETPEGEQPANPEEKSGEP